ncbi:MAG: hypothetical protein ACE5IO_01185 [Thermoplasmata archaeon]
MDEMGVEGSFEEVPSILIVIVATFLFLMGFANGFLSHSRFREENEINDRLSDFCNSVLSYDPLLFRSKTGQLDSSRLNDYTRQLLNEHFDPHRTGFHFNLTVIDVSSYDRKYDWFAGEELSESSVIRTTQVPAIVSNESGQHHPVLLKITIWR